MTSDHLQDKRTAVLQAALELISEKGFHGTPMSQVAQAANVGVGTIYRYFASKEDLITALYTDLKTQVAQAMLIGYSNDLPIRVRFTRIQKNLFNYYLNHPKELRFLEQYSNSPFIDSLSREEGLRMLEPITELFLYAQQQQVIKEMPVVILMQLVYGATVALVKLRLSGSVAMTNTDLDAVLDVLWDAIKR